MSTRVIRVTVDGRTTTVRATDPGRVLNVGPAGAGGGGSDFTAEAPLDLTDDVLTIDDSGYEVAGAAAIAQAAAVQRANHTGTQAISTVTGLQAALDGKADDADVTALDGRLDTLEAVDNATQAELDAHAAAANPHPTYLTTVEGDAAYDAIGAAAAAQAASQPVDSDLTAIAALTTTAYGRALLALADAAAARSAFGLVLGTDIYSKAAVDSGFQPLDSDLTAIAALTTTSTGRSLLAGADAAALRTILALGNSATKDVGTSSAQVAQGDHTHAGGSGITELARDLWNPATAAAPSSTSAISGPTYTDVSNIESRAVAITFTAPASGAVWVTAEALVDGNGQIAWALKEGSTIVGVGTQVAAGSSSKRAFCSWLITGLTASSSHTYKLAHATSTGQCNIYAGGGSTNPCGPLIMRVLSA